MKWFIHKYDFIVTSCPCAAVTFKISPRKWNISPKFTAEILRYHFLTADDIFSTFSTADAHQDGCPWKSHRGSLTADLWKFTADPWKISPWNMLFCLHSLRKFRIGTFHRGLPFFHCGRYSFLFFHCGRQSELTAVESTAAQGQDVLYFLIRLIKFVKK